MPQDPGDEAGQDAAPPGAPAGQRWRRAGLLVVLGASLCGLGIAAAGVVSQVTPRTFTTAQRREIQNWEVGNRWRALPVSVIFPASVTYQLSGATLDGTEGLKLSAHRIGVAPPATCAGGADSAAARVLRRYHCATLLRATYTDSTGSMVATVGVAVLPDIADATAAGNRLGTAAADGEHYGVRSAAVGGTVAEHFADGQRQLFLDTEAGPYVILTTVGYSDGRPRTRSSSDHYLSREMASLAQGLSQQASGVLGTAPPVPACPGAPGC
jgi:hypothetical protein